MTEQEMFEYLLEKDPTPGEINRVSFPEKRLHITIPGWLVDKEEDNVTISRHSLFNKLKAKGITIQVVYDTLVLGITSITERPVCPICGDPLKFKGMAEGYTATCCKEECTKEKIKQEVTDLWKDEAYRKHQVDRKIEWMNQPEYIQFFRDRALRDWSNKEYRDKQIVAHIEYARLNPDKIHSNLYGDIECTKSLTGSIKYDSSWERDFIQFCDNSSIISFIDRPGLSISYILDDLERNYIPDFKITLTNNINLLVEIKGDWLLEEKQTLLKLEAGRNYVNSTDIYKDFIVLTEKDLYVVQSKPVINSDNLNKILTQYL